VTAFVALLRGINLGKRQLKMDDLRRIAAEIGLESPKTYIASGNLLFLSDRSEKVFKVALEEALAKHMGSPVGVMIRTAQQMAEVAEANPFAIEPGNRVVAIFLDDAPAKDSAATAKNLSDERIALGAREIYVHYPGGMGRSKLRLPARIAGTARNMNTVGRLAELAKEVE
jgi:uncharacterized protein (DUF1697 family)